MSGTPNASDRETRLKVRPKRRHRPISAVSAEEPRRSTGSARIPFVSARRWGFLAVVVGTTLAGLVLMVGIVRAEGLSLLEILILGLFGLTFGWITIAFWTAIAGFVLRIAGRDPLTLQPLLRDRAGVPVHPLRAERAPDPMHPPGPRADSLRTRTALVMPAFNEDPDEVMRALGTTLDSLAATGHVDAFDLILLSDSTDPALIEAEEAAWTRFRSASPHGDRLRYRRRERNEGRKAGNVAEFLASRGGEYTFTVVLDADSVMSGATLVEMVRIMEANPKVGLLQTVPVPARQRTLFGRILQFAATVHSPVLATGQSFWQTDAANYWGHNAIFRTRAFREHCRLPVLHGQPPLGGEILSHDFVEAALLKRAGWDVLLVPEFEGSHEEVPDNLVDYARRDRRWAQGSLQHLRLLKLPGLHPLSRIHFVMGAMGYLSSCLWLLILLASTAYVLLPAANGLLVLRPDHPILATWPDFGGPGWGSLLAITGAILFLPKILGVGLALADRPDAFGGRLRLLSSAGLEALFAAILAPVMMVYHARFVLGIVGGRSVVWAPQTRDRNGIAWAVAVRDTLGLTTVGVVWGALTLYASWSFFLWLTPILLGLVFAAPLVYWTSSRSLGERARRAGLFIVPAETRMRASMAERRPHERLDEFSVAPGRSQ